ncbi:MAG: hypothetical protein A2600_10490 [Candidatus Lambdaproteobacteria bacterium RIFOXYD1_FULL_56_27]|uniref:Methyl-accepting transducer domain-containing protein n=1 Tax=Candidatus Lambdaproteobacteria bacterium RIFOXYD2_FULL_56_26 TaxID=1817773 RepID=A0A1F6GQC5_9PROT|nr:MAG: hypothetical protein A2557_09195 [Candidatus Lambdaproteobacteria bacterium RIFOXYD2_FULL_56_26]OGH04109.1 MAG: hypothetical protein A2426_02585 [Candidatus Lambdaproteobacteria bacterium RIFOXYC1_FULL_56_13]OGH06374.1 MAG: hypothetical protein A2600_10490 [Candidatus Lambdaproteobacteria bacterium RIFOXYD1_FULL_56_27]
MNVGENKPESALAPELQAKLAQLEQELSWRRGKWGVLEHYVKNIRYIAAEHPGKLAIAVIGATESLPFDPFSSALDTQNHPVQAAGLALPPGEHWSGRYLAYYSSLDSHLLKVYQDMKTPKGTPLAPKSAQTLTGIPKDPNSRLFDRVCQSRQTYKAFLNREKFGSDLIIKAFPLFGPAGEILAVVSFTHDVSSYLDQKGMISEALSELRTATAELFSNLEKVQEVSGRIDHFSKGVNQLEQEVQSVSDQVKGVAQNFDEAARKIKMLSLNAKIESSKAGESGRGFTVIANEIQNLTTQMRQTIDRLEKMNGSLAHIQEESVGKLSKINELTNEIGTLASGLRKEGEHFESLIDSIGEAEKRYEAFVQEMIA